MHEIITDRPSFQLNEFIETFATTGPGAPTVGMDLGLTLIESYTEKLNYFEAQRLDLCEYNMIGNTKIGLISETDISNYFIDHFVAMNLPLFAVHAERLFDMELTDYTEFNRIKREFEYLKLVSRRRLML